MRRRWRGAPPGAPELPPIDVEQTNTALHLALGDLLSHASSTANDARLATLAKIITPRRTNENASDAKKDKNDEDASDTKTKAKSESALEKEEESLQEAKETPATNEAASLAPPPQAPEVAEAAPGPARLGNRGRLARNSTPGKRRSKRLRPRLPRPPQPPPRLQAKRAGAQSAGIGERGNTPLPNARRPLSTHSRKERVESGRFISSVVSHRRSKRGAGYFSGTYPCAC